MDVNKLWTAVGVIGAIVAAVFFLPVLISWLQTGRQGAKRVQELDASNASTQEIAKSGGRTGLTLFIGLLAFGIPVTIIFWIQTGHSFISYPLVAAGITLINWGFNLVGIGPVIVIP